MKTRIISENELRQKCPSIFSQTKATHLSDKYEFVPTWPVIQKLQSMGWQVIGATQQGRRESAKHIIRLIQTDKQPDVWGRLELEQDETMSIALVGSHDGSRALQGIAGILVTACLNGLLASKTALGAFRFVHRTYNSDNINNALQYFQLGFSGIQDTIAKMKATKLEGQDIFNFALAAKCVRWQDVSTAPQNATVASILQAHRSIDNNNTLWSVFNRVQENVMQHRISGVRRIRAVNEDIRINQALWDLAVTYLKPAKQELSNNL